MTVFGLKIGSGFGEPDGTPPTKNSQEYPWGLDKPKMSHNRSKICPKAFKLVVSGRSISTNEKPNSSSGCHRPFSKIPLGYTGIYGESPPNPLPFYIPFLTERVRFS